MSIFRFLLVALIIVLSLMVGAARNRKMKIIAVIALGLAITVYLFQHRVG